jgi:hypothetical protein
VQVSKAALDDPALAPEAGAMRAATAGDHGRDRPRPQQPAMLVVVMATVGRQPIGPLAWPTDLAGDRSAVEGFDQRISWVDVVAVASGQGDRKRDAAGVDEQVVL